MTLDDKTFFAQFHDQSLNPEHFDHRGHLRIAWLHLKRYPPQEACARVCDGIHDLATALGAAEKFHYSLSEALVLIMAGRMQGSAPTDFEAFLAANPDLLADARGLLATHYSDERLESVEARRHWVEPDLAPFEMSRRPKC